MLANDQHEVAKPTLLNNGLLDDAELTGIVRHRAQEHRLSIALRPNISEHISSVLAETDDEAQGFHSTHPSTATEMTK